MKHLAMTAVAVATAAALFGPSAPAEAGPGHAAFQRQYYPDVDWITCEINKERAAQGQPPLLIVDRASDVARSHARDMATLGKLTSTGSDGRDQRTRLADAGIHSKSIHELMFWGYSHDGYFADTLTDPENKNYPLMMSPDIVAIGLGYDKKYMDVNLLSYHRRLNARSAVCARHDAE
ncbi:CAP domain-containing protein [Nonomuraea endophytica]|uniref:CAP domain-containing protein n=1 Tax=Nonomuraea endophytica TaxID=714136 RepID=UPI0037C60A62